MKAKSHPNDKIVATAKTTIVTEKSIQIVSAPLPARSIPTARSPSAVRDVTVSTKHAKTPTARRPALMTLIAPSLGVGFATNASMENASHSSVLRAARPTLTAHPALVEARRRVSMGCVPIQMYAQVHVPAVRIVR